jgi:uncharacterized membrane protein
MKNARSFKLFLASMIVIVLTFVFSLLWETLGFGNNATSLFISIAISLVLSTAGVVVGVAEIRKKELANVWFGLIGNILVIAALSSIALYGLEKLI